MSIPAWDVGLPQILLAEGYGESMADNLLRSNMDIGPAKQRRRSAAGPRPVNGKIKVTATELATFKTFYNTTLLNGSLRFSWVDPADGVTATEMRFTAAPSWSWADGYFDVSLALEIMP